MRSAIGSLVLALVASIEANSSEPESKEPNPRRTRVLLTGASDLAGSHALSHLLTTTDWDIACPVSFAHRGLPERLVTAIGDDQFRLARVDIIKCDLSSPLDDLTIKRIGAVDYIVSYASESSVDRSIANPVSFIKNNVDISLYLLELARLVKPKAFVLVSTDEVYGPAAGGTAHEEWSPIVPSNPYSASKAAQEAIAISYWRTYGVPLIIVNCMNLIGETQDPEKLVPLVISKVLTGKEVPIHASIDSDGGLLSVGSRFYLHVRILADAILFLLRRNAISMYAAGQVEKPDRWNVVGSQEVNNLEVAQMIAKMVGKPLHHKFVDYHKARPGHDKRYALNGTKIANAGWVAPTEFEESLQQVVEWTLSKPLWADRQTQSQDNYSSSSSCKVKLKDKTEL